LCAFAVVVGTLVLQGLTLKPLILSLDLADDAPVDREVRETHERLARLALQLLEGDSTPESDLLRREFSERLGPETPENAAAPARSRHDRLRGRIVVEQRRALVELRARGEIGDEAFHEVEARLDLAELNAGIQAE
jgi:CPA1 family monovalent cation:H+ antiporter